jgi:hypothetical protein
MDSLVNDKVSTGTRAATNTRQNGTMVSKHVFKLCLNYCTNKYARNISLVLREHC